MEIKPHENEANSESNDRPLREELGLPPQRRFVDGSPPREPDIDNVRAYHAGELDDERNVEVRGLIIRYKGWNALSQQVLEERAKEYRERIRKTLYDQSSATNNTGVDRMSGESQHSALREEFGLSPMPPFIDAQPPREPNLDEVRAYHTGELDDERNAEVRGLIIRYKGWNALSQQVLEERAKEYRERTSETLGGGDGHE